MSFSATSVPVYQADNAGHQAFVAAIRSMLTGAGLTQTSDTGQINPATVARPAANAVSGYEIWRFNDTEHATTPIFLKIEYGSQSGAQTHPVLRITMGTGTNGAGTLTGLMTSDNTTLACHTSSTTSIETAGASRPGFASYADGHFIIAWGLDATGPRGAYYVIERPLNSDGTKDTSGAIFMYRGFTTTSVVYYTRAMRATSGHGAGGGSVDSVPVIINYTGQDDNPGADIALFPMAFAINGNLRFSSLLCYRASAIGEGSIQSVTVFGGAKNYRTLGPVAVINGSNLAVPYY